MTRSVDWRTLLQVDATLPTKLDRAFESIERIRRSLVDDITAASATAAALGLRLDTAESDIDDLRADVDSLLAGAISTDGSIFSMVGPGGAAAPIVAYDFTQLDPGLTSAQNLAAANMSGNSAYDLISDDGTDILVYSALGGDQRQMVPHAMPFAARPDGGGLLTAGNGVTSQFARTNGSPTGLRLAGAFTGEILLSVVTLTAGNQFHAFSYVGGGGNAQYLLFWDNTGTAWKYLHQHGAAVSDTVTLHSTSAAVETNQILQHFVLTRAANGLDLKLYRNGRLVGAGASVGNAPTGGAGAELRIGQAVASRLCTLGARFFDVELTAAQVRESWQRTSFGVAV